MIDRVQSVRGVLRVTQNDEFSAEILHFICERVIGTETQRQNHGIKAAEMDGFPVFFIVDASLMR